MPTFTIWMLRLLTVEMSLARNGDPPAGTVNVWLPSPRQSYSRRPVVRESRWLMIDGMVAT